MNLFIHVQFCFDEHVIFFELLKMDILSKSMWIEETLVIRFFHFIIWSLLFSFSSLPLKNPRSRQSSVANSGDWLIIFYWSVFLDSSGKLWDLFSWIRTLFLVEKFYSNSHTDFGILYMLGSWYFIVLVWICILWNKLRSNWWLVKFCQNGGDLMQEKGRKGGGQLGLNRNRKTCKIGILDYGYFWIIFL